jgi:hypothetical protein
MGTSRPYLSPDFGIRAQPLRKSASSHRVRRLERAEQLADVLDAKFNVPFTPLRIGWDGIIGLLPGGDLLTAIPALYIILLARRSGVPKRTLVRMGLNLGLDTLLGLVPILGDLLDIGFHANQRNAQLFRQALASNSSWSRNNLVEEK